MTLCFFSSRRRHTRLQGDWSSDVCSSDLRVGKLDEAALAQRVEGNDRHSTLTGLLQVVQHPWAVSADVLAEEEDAVGLLEVVQRDRPDRYSDALRQRYRGALVAHVRTVRQVVRAVQPCEKLVHVRSFERSPAGHVE